MKTFEKTLIRLVPKLLLKLKNTIKIINMDESFRLKKKDYKAITAPCSFY